MQLFLRNDVRLIIKQMCDIIYKKSALNSRCSFNFCKANLIVLSRPINFLLTLWISG